MPWSQGDRLLEMRRGLHPAPGSSNNLSEAGVDVRFSGSLFQDEAQLSLGIVQTSRPGESLRTSHVSIQRAGTLLWLPLELRGDGRVRHDTPSIDPADTCLALVAGRGAEALQRSLSGLSGDRRDHAIASVYTLLLPEGRRKQLGAYFTPPHLVRHLLMRLEEHGLDLTAQSVHDPAAGGAAFVVPLVRRLAARLKAEGVPAPAILESLQARLSGMELDDGLARLSNALVRQILLDELDIVAPEGFSLVRQGDSLVGHAAVVADVIVGNPPYAKVGAAGQREWAPRFPDILGGQLNLYAMFLRRSMDMARPGGLVGFVVPTSFLQGPEFRTLRIALLKHADLLCLDLIDKRSGVFLDVTQDTCFVVFRRHPKGERTGTQDVPCVVLHPDGSCEPSGRFSPPSDGSPWRLPPEEPLSLGGRVLADYGYRCAVGYLVVNRQGDRIVDGPGEGRAVLVRAACVRPEGRLDLDKVAGQHVTVTSTARYVVRGACVVMQRTANRKQVRRLNAAHASQELVVRHGGLVGENHVLFLLPNEQPKVSVSALARLLNSMPVNNRWEGMCGSASVSAKLLALLDLPLPALVEDLERLPSAEVDDAVSRAYSVCLT